MSTSIHQSSLLLRRHHTKEWNLIVAECGHSGCRCYYSCRSYCYCRDSLMVMVIVWSNPPEDHPPPEQDPDPHHHDHHHDSSCRRRRRDNYHPNRRATRMACAWSALGKIAETTTTTTTTTLAAAVVETKTFATNQSQPITTRAVTRTEQARASESEEKERHGPT